MSQWICDYVRHAEFVEFSMSSCYATAAVDTGCLVISLSSQTIALVSCAYFLSSVWSSCSKYCCQVFDMNVRELSLFCPFRAKYLCKMGPPSISGMTTSHPWLMKIFWLQQSWTRYILLFHWACDRTDLHIYNLYWIKWNIHFETSLIFMKLACYPMSILYSKFCGWVAEFECCSGSEYQD